VQEVQEVIGGGNALRVKQPLKDEKSTGMQMQALVVHVEIVENIIFLSTLYLLYHLHCRESVCAFSITSEVRLLSMSSAFFPLRVLFL
jgi:hypothetical protein